MSKKLKFTILYGVVVAALLNVIDVGGFFLLGAPTDTFEALMWSVITAIGYHAGWADGEAQ